jgi:hypothetical protein
MENTAGRRGPESGGINRLALVSSDKTRALTSKDLVHQPARALDRTRA